MIMVLESKTALVTGAARGIGRAIAQSLARAGAAVVVNDIDEHGAECTAAEIRKHSGKAVSAAADIADLSTHETLVARALEQFGRLDILVNNAGIQFHQPFLESRPEAWDRTLAVNVKAPFFLAQCAARRMIATASERPALAGTILNIASIHDSVALRDRAIYAVSKGGMRMLTRALAFELAEHQITVNGISPGAILTDINRETLSHPGYREAVLKKIPLGRIGEVADIAEAAVFLVSPAASYITGATVYIDGGILVQ
jgi:glucose 1-dehydrogenase